MLRTTTGRKSKKPCATILAIPSMAKWGGMTEAVRFLSFLFVVCLFHCLIDNLCFETTPNGEAREGDKHCFPLLSPSDPLVSAGFFNIGSGDLSLEEEFRDVPGTGEFDHWFGRFLGEQKDGNK
mmetsp:Transcript_40235/g.104269  ORF Transcript_40235/g.104269 Transcript_40235/m.104269 type:complete len:124 (+) Transcript_40235:3068-3439(+)